MSKGLLAAIAVFTVGVAAPSYAADMPVKAAPSYVAAPGYSWTGFYIGGHVGGGWAHSQSTTTDTSTNFPAGFTRPAFDNASWLAGGQAGFNWQFAPQWVVGVEGEWSWPGIKATTSEPYGIRFPPQLRDLGTHGIIGCSTEKAAPVGSIRL